MTRGKTPRGEILLSCAVFSDVLFFCMNNRFFFGTAQFFWELLDLFEGELTEQNGRKETFAVCW